MKKQAELYCNQKEFKDGSLYHEMEAISFSDKSSQKT